jgi:hypothetical protein
MHSVNRDGSMKKFILAGAILYVCSLSLVVAADTSEKSIFPQANWISQDSNDRIMIQNGAAIPMIITIIVNDGNNAAGATVRNCGVVNHIDPGSAAVCSSNDGNNPVTLTSDSASLPATGTYQMQQK